LVGLTTGLFKQAYMFGEVFKSKLNWTEPRWTYFIQLWTLRHCCQLLFNWDISIVATGMDC